MKTQTFKIRKRFIPNFLVLSASAVLVLFGTLLIASPVSTNTNAEDAPATDGISLVTSKTIEASIHPEENGTLSIVKDTVIGSTSSAYGYELYVSTSSTDNNDIYLNGNTENSEATKKISATTGTYDTPAALDITNGATWGYAVAGLGSFDASYNTLTPSDTAKFAAMPTVANKQLIHEVNTATTDDETEIYYGIKTDSTLEPGLYKTEILYTAVSITPPLTAKAILGSNNNLNFVYDRNTYAVNDSYTDNLGETEITAVYDVPATADWGWLNYPEWTKSNANSANFDLSFHDFKPTTTAYWFYGMSSLSSVSNSTNLNLSEVTTMAAMFEWVNNVAIDEIEEWDVSNVIDMNHLFDCATINQNPDTAAVNIDLSEWNVSNVVNMASMFSSFGSDSSSINLGDIGKWETGNVTDMSGMFSRFGSSYNEDMVFDLDLSGWDVSHVTDMHSMFMSAIDSDYYGGSYFSVGDLGGWDVKNVTDMSYMFDSAGLHATTWYVGDLSHWDVGNVTSMSNMFYWSGGNADEFNIGDLSGWDVKNVTKMDGMFEGAGGKYGFNIGDIGGWNVSNVTRMEGMFRSAGSRGEEATWYIGDIGYIDEDHPGWDVSNVENMTMMFAEAGIYTDDFYIGDLSHWNVTKVTDMSYMFRHAGSSSNTFYLGDLSSWNVENVTSMDYMLYGAGQTASDWYIGDISGWDVSKVKNNHNNFIISNKYGANASVVNNQPNWQ